MNVVDARTDIEDDELYWSENAVTIGKGAIQIVPAQGAAVARIAAGIASLWGFTLNGNPVMISINNDGSVSQITPGGGVTTAAVAGTVTTAARATIWQTSPILIVDPTKGYFSWDGTTFTTIDATKTGTAIAVFQGRAWIASSRTIRFTAPATFNDFAAGDGAGSTIVTDAAFVGNIVNLVSALEQLWIIGQSAIEALSNVTATGSAPNVVTAFTITNIVTGLGSGAPNSSIGYFRALSFMAPYGAWALSGVTPQQLSEKLDRLFPALTLTPDVPTAIAVVQSLNVLCFLVNYTPSLDTSLPVPQSGLTSIAPLVLCFTKGKWFVATQGALTWITTLISSTGVSQAWGTDGSNIFQLFGAATTTKVNYKIQGKLYAFGRPSTHLNVLTKFGIQVQAPSVVTPTVTIDTEITSISLALTLTNTLVFTGTGGAPITFTGAGGVAITWITSGQVLAIKDAAISGHYLGFSIAGNDPPYRIQAVQFEVHPSREWATSP